MDRSATFVAVLGVGIAAVLMLPVLGAGPLVLDEHVAYWLSAPDGPLPIWERSFRYAAAPPLANWAQAAAMFVFGESEFALRLPSLAAYMLAVGILAFGGRSAMGGFPAALAACMLAVHPDVVDEVRVGRTYGLVLLWITLLVLMTLRWRVVKIGWIDGVVWGLLAAAAVWTHVLTIPVVGMSALMLGVWDAYRRRSLRAATVLAWLLGAVLCLPLVPMVLRIWEWQAALNYVTGDVSLRDAVGPFVWLALPLAAVITTVIGWARRGAIRLVKKPAIARIFNPCVLQSAARIFNPCVLQSVARIFNPCVLQHRRITDARIENPCHGAMRHSPPKWPSAVVSAMALGLVPLLVLVVLAQGELSSLSNPRYRVPLAAANACLLALICARLPARSLSVACAAIAMAAAWMAVGRLPTEMVRLGTPQAVVWKDMAETLARVVDEQRLGEAPVFVQSGLIEGTLIRTFPEDIPFHGYVSSRLGRFYARTPNPRYALPLLWGGDNAQLLQFFGRTLAETAARTPADLFVAVATDTDVNRISYAGFVQLLEQFGYEGTPIAGEDQWAVLYHYRRRNGDAPAMNP